MNMTFIVCPKCGKKYVFEIDRVCPKCSTKNKLPKKTKIKPLKPIVSKGGFPEAIPFEE